MRILKTRSLRVVLLMLALFAVVLAGCVQKDVKVNEVPAEKEYTYINPDETKAETDAGIVIDGVLDEEAYKNNNWLYLHNEDGGNKVDIAMTSYFGEKGMYFVYDVTESVPIYVNLDRASYMNSCIEMYLAHPRMPSAQDNGFFEIDLLPTGDMIFKKANGKYGYENVATTDDIMAVLGATTKGGEVNTEDCYGYCMELFIPWDYLQWLEMDVAAMKDGFVYVSPAHITSNNLTGTDTNLDRYWYFFGAQYGAEFSDVSQYFRFDGQGVIGNVPVTLEQGEHYTIHGNANVLSGMRTVATIVPEKGYALTSIIVNGKEMIQDVSFNEDGSVSVSVLSDEKGVKISAKAEAITEGNKTLSGKVVLNNIGGDSLKGVLVTYIGPKGEKPLQIDANGKFQLQDLAQGYYVLKAEKEGYKSVSRGIYLNQDFYTELTLEYDFFQVTKGSSWILDTQNDGVLYKLGGQGQVLSNATYRDFTFRVNLKYDKDLAKQGTGDFYFQQRSGMQIKFSNGKSWHIDLLKEGDKYILQYAKHSGNNSLTNWKTIHTLTDEQAKRYTGGNGIQLSVMRQGNYAAIWLDNALIKIEVLDEKLDACTAQLGIEAWIANSELMTFPFSIAKHSTVDVKSSPFLVHAKSWNISGQYAGTVTRYGVAERQWLDSVIKSNDVTVTIKDTDPDAKNFSFGYVFKFSNKEQFRVRLNHTDTDGKFRIQAMAGSTVAPAWKNAYTLTEEEAAKALGDGIQYRVQILGTDAYVYLEGKEVCVFDLSKVIATGKPSGIEKATSTVSFSFDGNMNGTTVIPFKFVNTGKEVTVQVAEAENGTIIADKEVCKVGDSITLTVKGDAGYYYTELLINGEKVAPNWDGTYTFKAEAHRYIVSGTFATGKFAESDNWNLFNQNQGTLKMNSHATGNSGWLNAIVDGNDISTFVRDASADAKDFSMIYHFTFSNGETLRLRLNHTDGDGKYRVQIMDNTTLADDWTNPYTLTDAQAAKVAGEGIFFRVAAMGGNALVYIDGQKVATIDISKKFATGEPSNVADSGVRIKLRVDGNLGQEMEIPFELWDTSKLAMVNIAELTNGTVTADKTNYQLGETINLTVAPNAGYAQKLYINGEPLLLDWKTNIYSFVADRNSYDITGSFEPSIDAAGKDAARWDAANQAHGIINAYYPANDDAWWVEIKGNYASLSVMAKNYLPTADTQDGNGKVGFSIALRATMDNGKTYAFRIFNDKGTYAYSRSAASGSVAGWGGWKALDAAAVAAITGDGVEFKLRRTAANTLTLSVNGVVLDTYTMDGVTSANKVVSLDICQYGNKGQKIEIPFELKTPTDAPDVQLNIAEMTGGTVTPELNKYQVGDTVTLLVTPNEGNAQKLFINGEPLMLDYESGKYRFVTTEETYTITGGFEPKESWFWTADWNLINQGHGIAHAPAHTDGKSATGELVPEKGIYNHVNVLFKDVSHGEQKEYAIVLKMAFADGKLAAVRLIDRDDNGKYCLQAMGDSFSSWNTFYWLTDAENAAVKDGNGVLYGMTRAGTNLKLLINGNVVKTIDMSSKGVTADTKLDQVKIQVYNFGYAADIPYEFDTIVGKTVNVNIPALANGTVTPDRAGYEIGDTVTLTVTPNAGYAQKLFVNGEPLKLDWNSKTYSFQVTEDTYKITGSFEPAIDIVPKDAGRWNLANQAHGTLTTYYPNNNDSWWLDINGEYKSITVMAKNYLSTEESKDSGGTVPGYHTILRMVLDNGKAYAFRIYNDKGTYAASCSAESGAVTGWGNWKNINEHAAAITGDGVAFKVERVDANTLAVSVNGTVLIRYTMEGVTADNKVVSVSINSKGNKGQYVEMPFTLVKQEEDITTPATITIPTLENGTVTADKSSYNVGDTVTLTVTPNEDYCQKLYIDGQPLLLDYATGKYSFVATKATHEITGSFEPKQSWFWTADWNLLNQGHNIAHAPAVAQRSGDLVPAKGSSNGVSVLFKDVSKGAQKEFAIVLKIHFIDGKKAEVRLIDRDDNGKYCLQAMGDSFSSWDTFYWLSAEENEAVLNGDGVWYEMTREGTKLYLRINGNTVKQIDMSGKGITAETAIDQVKIQTYNFGYPVDVPYTFQVADVKVDISSFANGTVTADKESYKVGDIATLTVTPAAGYAQKLYINGEPVLVDTNSKYSFVIEAGKTYSITGEFVSTSGKWFWTAGYGMLNQAHGVVYAPAVSEKNGELVPTADKCYGGKVLVKDPSLGAKQDYAVVLKMAFANGQKAEVRLVNKNGSGAYMVQSMSGMLGTWKWFYDLNAAENAAVATGNGVWFSMVREGTTIKLMINDTVVKTLDVSASIAADTVLSQFKLQTYNFGYGIDIPYEFYMTE